MTCGYGAPSRLLADALQALGEPRFPAALFAWLDCLVPIYELFVFQRPLDWSRSPTPLLSFGRSSYSSERASAYCARFHGLDPINSILVEDGGADFAAVSRQQIADLDYYETCYSYPRFSGKVSLWRRAGPRFLIVSLYRSSEAPDYGAAEFDALRDAGRLIFPMIEKHEILIRKPGAPRRAGESLLEDIENKLAALPIDLTPRQLSVCARTLIGMTAKGVALDLGVSVSSVVTYRRRAYERLGIATGAELARLLL